MTSIAEENTEMIEGENIQRSDNLPDVVASMEMLTVNTEVSQSTPARYQLRKRVHSSSSELFKRRCSLKPVKRSCSVRDQDGNIQDYYLNKTKEHKPTTTLETIYEEIDGLGENSFMISVKKFKRVIQFAGGSKSNPAKIKKRRAKIKRAFGSKFKVKCNSITMQALIKKLNAIRADAMSKTD